MHNTAALHRRGTEWGFMERYICREPYRGDPQGVALWNLIEGSHSWGASEPYRGDYPYFSYRLIVFFGVYKEYGSNLIHDV